MSKYTAPDPSRAALITIDTQRDTLDGQPFEIRGISAVLPQMKALLDAFRAAEKPIVHVVRIYKPDGSNVDPCRRAQVERGAPLVLTGSPGSQLAPALLPGSDVRLDEAVLLSGGIQEIGPDEVVMYKPRWGAFYKTPLEGYLRKKGVSTLIFSGCNFPNCPRTSIYEASERDFRIILVGDAVSGLYERGRDEMGGIGVQVRPTEDVVRMIHEQSGG